MPRIFDNINQELLDSIKYSIDSVLSFRESEEKGFSLTDKKNEGACRFGKKIPKLTTY